MGEIIAQVNSCSFVRSFVFSSLFVICYSRFAINWWYVILTFERTKFSISNNQILDEISIFRLLLFFFFLLCRPLYSSHHNTTQLNKHPPKQIIESLGAFKLKHHHSAMLFTKLNWIELNRTETFDWLAQHLVWSSSLSCTEMVSLWMCYFSLSKILELAICLHTFESKERASKQRIPISATTVSYSISSFLFLSVVSLTFNLL